MMRLNNRRRENMKKSFRIEGLGCANCAAKIQEGVGKIEGVKKAAVSFATAKLTVDCDGDGDALDRIVESIKEIVRDIEPDAELRQG
jgi:copper chaperone CopZ